MSSQHIILTALEDAVAERVANGTLDESVYDNEPRSHVFYPEPGESWDEDDIGSMKAVGQQDVLNKIRYWSRVLDVEQEREYDDGND